MLICVAFSQGCCGASALSRKAAGRGQSADETSGIPLCWNGVLRSCDKLRGTGRSAKPISQQMALRILLEVLSALRAATPGGRALLGSFTTVHPWALHTLRSEM